MGATVGTGVLRGGSGVLVGASTGVAAGVIPTAGAGVGGTAVAFPSGVESPQAATAKASAHTNARDAIRAKLRTVNLK